MVDFVRLQDIIKGQLEQDRSINAIEASGPTLETAVSEAALLLDIPVRRLEYEIIEKGSAGFLGTGKKDWKIRAYERAYEKKEKIEKDLFEDTLADIAPIIENKDSEVFVQLRAEGAFLKVLPPVGKGKKATVDMAMQALRSRNLKEIDEAMAGVVVREAAGLYVKAGTFERQSSNNSMITVEIAEGEMKAFIQVTPPGEGGCDIAF